MEQSSTFRRSRLAVSKGRDDQEYNEEEDAEDVSGRGTETDEHVWPSPREEDDQARSEEEDAGDVSGRGSETGTRSNPPGNFK